MAYLSTELVSSRANKSLLVPHGLTKIEQFMETLVFFYGRERLEQELDLLEENCTGDFNESLLCYQSLFRDGAEVTVDHNCVIKYTADPCGYFKAASKQCMEIENGYKIFGHTKKDGQNYYQVGLIGALADDAIWVTAPNGRPDLAVQAAKDLIEADVDLTVYKEGYEIVRETLPAAEEKQDVSTQLFKDYSVELEASRGLRKSASAESKSMVTPGHARGGTHWKFHPMMELVEEWKPNLIILAGTGANGNSGMVTSLLACYSGKVIAYDPRARVETYPKSWIVHSEPFVPEEYDGDPPDMIITDVAVGNANSYDISYTVKFAVALKKAFPNIPVVYKDSIKNLGKRKCLKIYYGRGHNTEMFVYSPPKDCKSYFVSVEDQRKVFQQKREANLARDLFHCFKLRAPTKKQEILAPYPFVVGCKTLKPWSKHRKYNSGLSVSGYVNLLAGIPQGNLEGDLASLVRLVRAFVFAAPEYDVSDLLGNARHVYKLINKSVTGLTYDQQERLRNRKDNPKRRRKVDQNRQLLLNSLRERK